MAKSGEDLGFEILRALRRILRKVSEHSRRLFRDAGLTVPQLLCLKAIAEAPAGAEVTAADVSRKVHLSPPTISRILDRLEGAGLLLRERDTADRRRVRLSLTGDGRARVRAMPRPLTEEFLDRLATLSEAERRRLLDALRRIVDMMEAGDLDVAPLLIPGEDVKSQ